MSHSRKFDALHSLPRPRSGTLLIEVTVALAIVAIVAAIVAQSIVWSLQERASAASHQAANELAANVLEAARALPFEKLDSQWADAQSVPSEMTALLPDGKVIVTVEASPASAHTKRVTVEVRWPLAPDQPPQSMRLTTLLSG